MNVKARATAVKNHVKENKVAYAIGTTVVVVACGVTYFVTKSSCAAKAIAAAAEISGDAAINSAPVMNNYDCINPIMNVFNFAEDSTPSRAVGLLDENDNLVAAWKSMSETARSTGHHLRDISKVVNGKMPHIKGDKFVALADVAEAAA